jgi:hypothetical protein
MRILYIPPEHSFAAFVECAIIGLDRFAMPGAVNRFAMPGAVS